MLSNTFTALEICAGGGGQAIGLEEAGFSLLAATEIDTDCCKTLKHNRPHWKVIPCDIKSFDGYLFRGVDLLAGGVPCPPFSVAGKQLGDRDERDLFPQALRLIEQAEPCAVLLENVRGLSTKRFESYREKLYERISNLGYIPFAKLLNAADYGVPQLRPRFIIVALRPEFAPFFHWPTPLKKYLTVSESIGDLMLSNEWKGGIPWLKKAFQIAPTIVGGSKKHGGPDLGPTRAKRKWAELGINGHGIANDPPTSQDPEDHLPKLTLKMVARLQGFPEYWEFQGGKTTAYRQIGNAFPPPVSKAVGYSIRRALSKQCCDVLPQQQSVFNQSQC